METPFAQREALSEQPHEHRQSGDLKSKRELTDPAEAGRIGINELEYQEELYYGTLRNEFQVCDQEHQYIVN